MLDGAEANLGLADQIAALRWVRRNIWSFGGDPSRVSVMGESAGAISIAALLALPDAASLFDRAIMQSGPPDARPPAVSGAVTRIMAKLLRIQRTARHSPTSPPALLAAQRRATAGTTPITGGPAFNLTIGGENVPRHPRDALAGGAGATIPVLMGSNTEEYRLWFIPTGLIEKIGRLHIGVAMAKFRISAATVRLDRRNRPWCSLGELFGALATDLLFGGSRCTGWPTPGPAPRTSTSSPGPPPPRPRRLPRPGAGLRLRHRGRAGVAPSSRARAPRRNWPTRCTPHGCGSPHGDPAGRRGTAPAPSKSGTVGRMPLCSRRGRTNVPAGAEHVDACRWRLEQCAVDAGLCDGAVLHAPLLEDGRVAAVVDDRLNGRFDGLRQRAGILGDREAERCGSCTARRSGRACRPWPRRRRR